MPNDLTISVANVPRAVADTVGTTRVVAPEPATQPKPSAAAQGPNPSLMLDPALGLVVITFRNEAGTVTTSIPSDRQLQAYQQWNSTHFGPAPAGMNNVRKSTGK